MKPAPFDYRLAESVEDAVSLLESCDGYAQPVAGGQTLIPLLNLRLVQPDRLVDISRIESLSASREENSMVTLGACVSHATIEDERISDPSNGLLAHVAKGIAYRSVRNRGTIGGSLAYADPSAEWPAVMKALGVEVEIQGTNRRRTVALDEFLLGPMKTGLGAQELLVKIGIPKLSRESRWGFRKLCRKSGDFAEALAVVILGSPTCVVIGATPAGPVSMPNTADCVGDFDKWSPTCEVSMHAAFSADIAAVGHTLDDYQRQIHRHTLCGAVKDALSK